MLINPAVQQPSSFTTVQPTQSQGELGRESGVRTDVPPVEQAPDASGAQNQQLQNEQRFQQQLTNQNTTDDRDAQSEQSGDREENALEIQRAERQAAEEQAAEQQRVQDEDIIRQLKARDREVRLHEAAHAAVGGRYAGAPQLDFERGPDGVNYAVSGEVSISVSPVPGDPQATIEKARIVRAAAVAPAEPSAQDRRVAAEATQLEADARAELQAQKIEAEQERRDRVEQGRAEDLEEDAANDESIAEEANVSSDEVSVAVTTQDQGADQQSQDRDQQGASQETSQARPNAKDQLEEILLGSQSVSQSLNQSGLVDAQNPYGRGGLIEFIV